MYITQDRRAKPRINCDYPAIVEGYDVDGSIYNDQAKLVNLSASGLFMLLNRDLVAGSKLSVTVHLCSSLVDANTPKIATNGIVVRSEHQSNGTHGIAVKFYHYRFL